MCCKCIRSNSSEVLHFRNVLEHMRRLYRGGGTHAVVWFQQKCIAAALLESCFCVRCSPVDLLRVFGAPYYGMASEGLLSLHHRLQIHCIANVNTCRKGLDVKTIVFCRSLQILTYFCKRKKEKKYISTDWGDIIYDAWNQDLLTIPFSDSSSWKVLYNPRFFFLEG